MSLSFVLTKVVFLICGERHSMVNVRPSSLLQTSLPAFLIFSNDFFCGLDDIIGTHTKLWPSVKQIIIL